jgi:parallel beta-helix repeat protein
LGGDSRRCSTPFPICSRDGLIDHNVAPGHPEDAAIYVGDSEDAIIEHNRVVGGLIGIKVENSVGVTVRRNVLTGNTAGILVVALPGLPVPMVEDVTIEDNVVSRNNLPNPIPPDSGTWWASSRREPGSPTSGGDVLIVGNSVIGNDSVGVAIIQNFLACPDPRVDPDPDDNEVRGNRILTNGLDPDPLRPLAPGADIVYDGSGDGNCFADNVF